MGSMVLEEQDAAYEVEFRFGPGGPAILGVWAKAETTDAKFTEWPGSYGRDEAVLTLAATSNGVARPVRNWTAKDGLRVAGAL
ncbi:hypothetical protein [Streptomyces bikiniensis]|nr:hypothetical protein [Streptomyces bikiniensis]